MGDESSSSLRMFERRVAVRKSYVVYGILGLFGVLLALVGLGMFGEDLNQSIGFSAMLVLFIAAMSLASVVFSGLQLGSRDDSFGLPAGSVRGLLAVATLLLFIAFALPLVRVDDNLPALDDRNQQTISVPLAQLDNAIKTHREQGFRVVVKSYGVPAVPPGTTDGTQSSDGRPEVPAELRLLPPDRFAERLSIADRIVGAVLTLLTAVSSFYFGSQSVSHAQRSTEAAPAPGPTMPGPPPPPDEPPAAAAGVVVARRRFETFKARLATARDTPVADDVAAERAPLVSAAEATLRKVEEGLTAAEALTSDLDGIARDLTQAIRDDARATLEARRAEQLAAIQKALPALEASLGELVKQIEAVEASVVMS